MREVVEALGLRLWGRVWGRPVYLVTEPLPLIGVIQFGVIDRGTNVLQVRPTTICPLSCIFCSVDAGPRSRWRQAEYIVEPEWLAGWVHKVAVEKGVHVEALIDGVGDPFAYPWLPRLVKLLKETGVVRSVAAETHGETLTKELIGKLEEAGLDRVNLSIESLNPEKARKLAGTPWYDVRRVIELAEYIARETSIDLHVTPVWLPGINDDDIVEIVKWAYRIGAGKKWPPVTIQKYIRHRYGRHPPGVREIPWNKFWEKMKRLEEELGVRLTWSMDEWGMRYAPRVRHPIRAGQRVKLVVAGPGWLRGEKLAVTMDRQRLVTIVAAKGLEPGDIVLARIIRDKDGIFIAKVV
ncbi:radical SAM protein [Hyperthermus butylicus]|uniref:Fe-S oxidoreductase n=1 Tax=Hyperthermus butylicus (strain DSM 5456 / JCM 9403 / PLM1-5) TaxID=415426 RepID=A2BJI5_HYPBU|nr:radical SAM protein [Hyperthermus butylicus]ABM80146.1 Fe-S oxidoreductase [Hyperthermus butylicus DSM 5456]